MKREVWLWTDAEERQFAKLWEAGAPVLDICAAFGIDKEQVYRKRRHLLLPTRTPGGLPGQRWTGSKYPPSTHRTRGPGGQFAPEGERQRSGTAAPTS